MMATDRQTKPEQSIACRDVMTPYPTRCGPKDTVDRVAQQMQDENVGAIPVTDAQQRLIGIITDRDIALRLITTRSKPARVKVAEVMTRRPIACRMNDHIQRAVDAMAKQQVRRIPVVDRKHRLVGIIAQADIARRLKSPQQIARLVKKVSQPKGGGWMSRHSQWHSKRRRPGNVLRLLGSLGLGIVLMYFFDREHGAQHRRMLVDKLRSMLRQEEPDMNQPSIPEDELLAREIGAAPGHESGQSGSGQGRIDEVGHSGVNPPDGPLPSGDAEIRTGTFWEQGEQGAAGYEDHGTSEVQR